MSDLEALWARVEALEQANARLLVYGLTTAGNLTLEDGGRVPSNPVKVLLGFLGRATGLYVFWQRRFGGQAQGEYWAGLETALEPPDGRPVAEGYGALPLRLWGQNVLLEANGALVVRHVVCERVYLAPPVYRHRWTGAFVTASGWSGAGEPLDAEGRVLGGIYYPAQLGTYLTVHEGRPVVVHEGEVRPL